jgi:hypothetical protein
MDNSINYAFLKMNFTKVENKCGMEGYEFIYGPTQYKFSLHQSSINLKSSIIFLGIYFTAFYINLSKYVENKENILFISLCKIETLLHRI